MTSSSAGRCRKASIRACGASRHRRSRRTGDLRHIDQPSPPPADAEQPGSGPSDGRRRGRPLRIQIRSTANHRTTAPTTPHPPAPPSVAAPHPAALRAAVHSRARTRSPAAPRAAIAARASETDPATPPPGLAASRTPAAPPAPPEPRPTSSRTRDRTNSKPRRSGAGDPSAPTSAPRGTARARSRRASSPRTRGRSARSATTEAHDAASASRDTASSDRGPGDADADQTGRDRASVRPRHVDRPSAESGRRSRTS